MVEEKRVRKGRKMEKKRRVGEARKAEEKERRDGQVKAERQRAINTNTRHKERIKVRDPRGNDA